MEREDFSGLGPDLKTVLGAIDVIYPEEDELAEEYLTLLWAHPGFQKALTELREEIEEYEAHGIWLSLDRARKGAQEADYPLVDFAEKWAISPAAAYILTRNSSEGPKLRDDEVFAGFKREARAIVIWESPFGYTLFVPRPVVKEQSKAVERWLSRHKTGPFERMWGRSGSSRQQLRPASLAVLPEFQAWLGGPAPIEIYDKKRVKKRLGLEFLDFVAELERLRKWMRAISPEGIPSKGPSKAWRRYTGT
ncbi:MAG TPA: hypothetical protein VFP23_07535 [Solirubrobacterales bacterium]|nr:hypothetical protein [Solirubrobacterales bacterium]